MSVCAKAQIFFLFFLEADRFKPQLLDWFYRVMVPFIVLIALVILHIYFFKKRDITTQKTPAIVFVFRSICLFFNLKNQLKWFQFELIYSRGHIINCSILSLLHLFSFIAEKLVLHCKTIYFRMVFTHINIWM